MTALCYARRCHYCRCSRRFELAKLGELVESVKRFLAYEMCRRTQTAAHLQLLGDVAIIIEVTIIVALVASATSDNTSTNFFSFKT